MPELVAALEVAGAYAKRGLQPGGRCAAGQWHRRRSNRQPLHRSPEPLPISATERHRRGQRAALLPSQERSSRAAVRALHADHDELGLGEALRLQPGARAAAAVAAAELLRDDALQPHPIRGREQRRSVADHIVAVLDAAAGIMAADPILQPTPQSIVRPFTRFTSRAAMAATRTFVASAQVKVSPSQTWAGTQVKTWPAPSAGEKLLHSPTKRKTLKRFRMEIRHWGHSSTRRKGVKGSGRRVGETHLHPFEANWVAAEGRVTSGNLRKAEAAPEGLQTFESVRAFVGWIKNQ